MELCLKKTEATHVKNEKLSKSLVFAEPRIYLRFEKNRKMNYFIRKTQNYDEQKISLSSSSNE